LQRWRASGMPVEKTGADSSRARRPCVPSPVASSSSYRVGWCAGSPATAPPAGRGGRAGAPAGEGLHRARVLRKRQTNYGRDNAAGAQTAAFFSLLSPRATKCTPSSPPSSCAPVGAASCWGAPPPPLRRAWDPPAQVLLLPAPRLPPPPRAALFLPPSGPTSKCPSSATRYVEGVLVCAWHAVCERV
jgi:hypothetical protein